MIYIKESFLDDHSIVIQADGTLDSDSIPILRKICERNLECKRKVFLKLKDLMYVSREGNDFLKAMEEKGVLKYESLTGPP